ncbi:hypothetical protein AK812_SmicGene19509 [Symbiodinium microadriaticum]|uniref:Uncharacterized protein n=1 Tax=Symbiodinium microadriaticum TaxID=2951 RepID=A0A1Q9DSD6_SYMMI|nr:hypothetical protein AK812_SmicGene19509 [Symbiodinium microadriaticum]
MAYVGRPILVGNAGPTATPRIPGVMPHAGYQAQGAPRLLQPSMVSPISPSTPQAVSGGYNAEEFLDEAVEC